MAKQMRMFKEADGPLATACDHFIDERDRLEAAKQQMESASEGLLQQLRAHNKSSVKHAGRIFSIRVIEAKERIAVRE